MPETGESEPGGEGLPTQAADEPAPVILGVRFEQLSRGNTAGPGVAIPEIREQPSVAMEAEAAHAESPHGEIDPGCHRDRFAPGTRAIERAVGGAGEASDRDAVGGNRSAGGTRDDRANRDTVEPHPAEINRLPTNVEACGVALGTHRADRDDEQQHGVRPGSSRHGRSRADARRGLKAAGSLWR